MLQLPCPHCGPRGATEFTYVGEATGRPDPASCDIVTWREHLYERDNVLGWAGEHWFHRAGCGQYLRVERHTLTNEIKIVVPAGAHSDDEGTR